jgi:HAE1 family hydrophobic/amphiphilic exporter-1
MVGGLVVSQALTLFTTPVVYLYLDRLSNAIARRTKGKTPGDEQPPAHDDHLKDAAE